MALQILASLRPAKDNEPSILDSDRLNIYDLTKMIQGTRAIVSIQLCARVALMVSGMAFLMSTLHLMRFSTAQSAFNNSQR